MNITNLDRQHQPPAYPPEIRPETQRYPFFITAQPWPGRRWLRFIPWLLLLLLWSAWLVTDLNHRHLGALLLPWFVYLNFLAATLPEKSGGYLWVQSRDSQFFCQNKQMIPMKILPESRFYPQFMLLSFRLANGQKKRWLIVKNQREFSRWLLYFLHEMENA